MRSFFARTFPWSVIAGVFLYAAGILFLAHPSFALLLRLLALACLALAALQRTSVMAWTLFSIVAGAELGADAPSLAAHLRLLAEIFLRLVRMIVAPLILGSLATGIAGHERLGAVGRLAWKTFVYFELVTTLALLIGAAAINLSRAGEGVVPPPLSAAASSPAQTTVAEPTAGSFLLNIFPENIALAVAQNQILQVAVFAILLGIGLSRVADPMKAPLLLFLRSLTETMFQMTRVIMYTAPVAAGAAIASTVASAGAKTLLPLAKLLVTFYAAAFAFIFLVLLPITLLARLPLRRLLRAIAEPAAIGFATTTSEAALPLAMENMERFGVPRSIVSFVIPSGYSFNMDGSSLYLSVAAIFAAQASGIHLSFVQQATMLLTLMVTSKGIAGVPRAVLAILLGTAASFHLSTAPILMILGIDALIDMGRTSLNVIGNCLASAVLSRLEKPA